MKILFAVCDVEVLKGPSHKCSINTAIYWLIHSIFNCDKKSHLLTPPPFLTSGDICTGFQIMIDPVTCVLCHLQNDVFLKITSSMTPADLLAASMATKPVYPHIFSRSTGTQTYVEKRITDSWSNQLSY